ncbi:MAG: phosphate ABC transporter substrate-binding protein PstS [Thermoleophilaceae bacterium]
MRIRATHAAAMLAAGSLAAGVPAAASAKPVITMSGSTSVAPLASLLARAYLKSCHKCVSFKLLQGGSNIGIADVSKGRVTIGNSSRNPAAGDPPGIVFNKIAGDGICLITNPANRLPNLDQAGVQSIFSGRARDWSAVPGATVGGTIDVAVRTAASGTHDAFQKIFLDPFSESSTAQQVASNGLAQQAVKRDKNAIAYVSLAFTGGTNQVSYKGVACNLRNAKSGVYGGLRNFWMVTRGAPSGAAGKWIKWIQSNKKASRIIATDWVPLH